MSARVEIWALFYRLMVVAFVIGAVVMGTMTYVIWRFRESHPKNREDITPAAWRRTPLMGHGTIEWVYVGVVVAVLIYVRSRCMEC